VSPQFDIVVIGGGIHGVGVAQAAAAAGYSVLLIERDAIAAHTSRRSSKLIHGGLRYLETAQFGLVRESLRERATLLRIAPHLVRLVPFYIPVYVSTRRRPWQIRAGLSLYALLGSLGVDNRFITVPRGQWNFLDGLRTEGLEAVFRYYDAQTDDALLAEAVWRSAQALGAERACPAEFLGAERADDGYSIRYLADGEEQTCSAGALVNATGAWANETLKHISPAPPPQAVELVQGTHIVLPSTVAQGIYYVEAPTDRRAVFVMPWQDKTLVGTTETAYHGDPAPWRRSRRKLTICARPIAITSAGGQMRCWKAGPDCAYCHRERVRIFTAGARRCCIAHRNTRGSSASTAANSPVTAPPGNEWWRHSRSFCLHAIRVPTPRFKCWPIEHARHDLNCANCLFANRRRTVACQPRTDVSRIPTFVSKEERMNIFVGNLAANVSQEDLRRLFAGFGTIVKTLVKKNTSSGRTLGYGHVHMEPESAAREAIEALHYAPLRGRLIRVRECVERGRLERRKARMHWTGLERRRLERRTSGRSYPEMPVEVLNAELNRASAQWSNKGR